ncbi:hypothetical protein [Sorangium sp. So ce381]|uniref:hypothetical protein n=1 Tax=Sorangium sp. So ce381 TaxID=3133307 RepID=UPI003F5B5761
MNKLARIASMFAAVAALAAVAAPAAAAAEGTPTEAAHHRRGKGRHQFPQDAAKFSKRVDEKIANQRAKVEAKMEKRGVPAARRVEVRKALDDVQAKVRAAVAKAAKDGVITQEEAKQVRKLAREARKVIAEQLGLGKKRENREKGTKHPARAQAA